MTFAGSNMELRVKASDLRAINRPLQCKMALEALKSDPKVLAGKLEPAPPAIEVYGTGGTDTVGLEPGATGFSRAPEPLQPTSSDFRPGAKGAAGVGGVEGFGGRGGGGGRTPFGGASAEFFSLFGGVAGFGEGGGGDDFDDEDCDDFDSTPRQRRKKKRKKKTVVIPAGSGEGGGGAAVEYDLPFHVQSVEGKQCSPSLRLKVPTPTTDRLRSEQARIWADLHSFVPDLESKQRSHKMGSGQDRGPFRTFEQADYNQSIRPSYFFIKQDT